jgi:hypothetical protein
MQEYGHRLKSIGVNAEELPAYVSLWQCVTSEAQEGTKLDRKG